MLKKINIRSFIQAFGIALLSNHIAAWGAFACHSAEAWRLEALHVNSEREGKQGCGVVRGGGRANANSHPATREMSSRSNPRADSGSGAATCGATASGRKKLKDPLWLSVGPRSLVCSSPEGSIEKESAARRLRACVQQC